MKAVLAFLFASTAAAAVIDAGLFASRDNFARKLRSIADSSVVVQRDNDDAALEDLSLDKKDKKDDLTTRNVGGSISLGGSVPLQARDETAGGGENGDNGMGNGKKNNGKSDGKATDGKKNNGKADGKATDGKKNNNGKADGKATDGKKNNGKSDGKATDAFH
ncbi:hypothetical protein LZ30DRAFT_819108 [Colletotrichum cereale]|nr:hypothetical protein LZ30DRAFT_819108 [Colletotrichum cereale]